MLCYVQTKAGDAAMLVAERNVARDPAVKQIAMPSKYPCRVCLQPRMSVILARPKCARAQSHAVIHARR